MKVKKLIEELSKMDPTSEVILQKDSEGNGYSPLAGIDLNAVYVPDSTYYGDVYSTEWTAQEACMNESEWKKILNRKRCVILFPTN